MKFSDAIDLYITDMRLSGRINTDRTERAYRDVLAVHCDDVNNRDPSLTGREDCKRTLARWKHPNTQGTRRTVLVSFYDWMMEEGYRPSNPARQTRKPKRRKTDQYRLNDAEAARLWSAARTTRERLVIHFGLGLGLRRHELRTLTGEAFARDGFCRVRGKGDKVRVIPIPPELDELVATVRASVGPKEYVICRQRIASPWPDAIYTDDRTEPASVTGVYKLVGRIGERAEIPAPGGVHPHMMRHYFADRVTKHCGIRIAQSLLGHADIQTTQIYLGEPTPDELQAAVSDLQSVPGLSPQQRGLKPADGEGGIRTLGFALSSSTAEESNHPALDRAARRLAPILLDLRLRLKYDPEFRGGVA